MAQMSGGAVRIGRLLIANRGEIAVRIARTARAMGIETVAVVSAADRGGAHAAACDVAIEIGPADLAESYLSAARILTAAQETGADAVHPGYGFLSEDAAFAEAVIGAGLVWVGPPPAAIRAMGQKDEAKRRMAAAGLAVVPGYHGADISPERLAAEAEAIGYPLLVKAVAGGGGRGMRLVAGRSGLAEAVAAAGREAARTGAGARVMLERWIARARHFEVQVMADSLGGAVHLFERDGSAQRRHQKVIEEAPAPGITAPVRRRITEAALQAVRAVGYVGAGTVEFLAEGAEPSPDAVYFLEMNTRLQVEHPVSEAVTGQDLVEWQIRIAQGEPLPRGQSAIALTGHAVEARIYAEDPAAGFAPGIGRITSLAWPSGPGIRVDAGVLAGDSVQGLYDPMVAKIVAYGPDRPAALARLSAALAETHLGGIPTNLGFLGRLLRLGDMVSGQPNTQMIEGAVEVLGPDPSPSLDELVLAAAALSGMLSPRALDGWRAWGPGLSHVTLKTGAAVESVSLAVRADGPATLLDGRGRGTDTRLVARALGGTGWQVGRAGGPSQIWHLHRDGRTITLATATRRVSLALHDAARDVPFGHAGAPGEDERDGPLSDDALRAPLPGRLVRIAVGPGEPVARGQVLAVMEAMKMEHALTAPRDARVATLEAETGQALAQGAPILRFEAAG